MAADAKLRTDAGEGAELEAPAEDWDVRRLAFATPVALLCLSRRLAFAPRTHPHPPTPATPNPHPTPLLFPRVPPVGCEAPPAVVAHAPAPRAQH